MHDHDDPDVEYCITANGNVYVRNRKLNIGHCQLPRASPKLHVNKRSEEKRLSGVPFMYDEFLIYSSKWPWHFFSIAPIPWTMSFYNLSLYLDVSHPGPA